MNVIAEELHAAQLEIILVIPAMKGGLVCLRATASGALHINALKILCRPFLSYFCLS